MAPTACMHASCRTGCRHPPESYQNPRALQAEVFPWSASVDSDILGMLKAPLPFQPFELDFQTLELDFQTLNLHNLTRVHDTLPHPQRPDDNLNFTRSPPPTNLLLFAFLSQNMPGDRTIAPEINISNNWHIILPLGTCSRTTRTTWHTSCPCIPSVAGRPRRLLS